MTPSLDDDFAAVLILVIFDTFAGVTT